jgi:hypothetical protein
MSDFDLFNGDADGIIARHQYRLVHPLKGVQLLSGLKRDVVLVRKLPKLGVDKVVVFDVSLESNEVEVKEHLGRGVCFTWYDHHRRGELKDGAQLDSVIDLSPRVCTSLLVDGAIDGAARSWAIAAAYGDNLREEADALGVSLGLSQEKRLELRELGETLNYNGYGEHPDDLAAWPVDVALEMEPYGDPFDYMRNSPLYAKIVEQKRGDEEAMGSVETLSLSTSGEVLLLPRGTSSRRMSGLYSNQKVNEEPDLAHAILTHLEDGGGYRVSIRSPKARPQGADVLAKRFDTGGGRSAAGGINRLPSADLERFFKDFDEVFAC